MLKVRSAGGSFASAGCLVLFSLPFAGVGTGVIVWAMMSLVTWSNAQGWVEVPAYIIEAQLNVHSDEDGSTYSVSASYRYTYEGSEYTGTRVAIDNGSDNIGDYHQRAAATLEAFAGSSTPFRCFVNPEAPEEALLFRDFRVGFFIFKLLFGLVFAAAGFGVLIAGLWGARREKATRSLETGNPDAPWRWKPEWESGIIKSSNKGAMIGGLFFAGLWNLISLPILFVLPWEEVSEEPFMLLILIFPLVGLGALAFAVYTTIRWFKFGETTFQMASVPGVIGGDLDGLIRIPAYLKPSGEFEVSLRNVRKRTTGSGKNRSTNTSTLWEAERTVPQEEVLVERDQAALPIHFTIPSDTQETDESNPNNKVMWHIEVKAEVPGVDYHAKFEVPVFRTEASREITADEAVTAQMRTDISVEEQLAAAGVDVMQTSQGIQFVFGMGRAWAGGLLVLVIGAVFLCVGIGIGLAGAPIIFPIVFPTLGGLAMLAGLNMLFGKMTVTIGSTGIDARTSLFGLGKTRHADVSEVGQLSHRVGMTVNEKPYYDVYLERKEGGSFRIGRTFASETHVVAYKNTVLAAMGL